MQMPTPRITHAGILIDVRRERKKYNILNTRVRVLKFSCKSIGEKKDSLVIK